MKIKSHLPQAAELFARLASAPSLTRLPSADRNSLTGALMKLQRFYEVRLSPQLLPRAHRLARRVLPPLLDGQPVTLPPARINYPRRLTPEKEHRAYVIEEYPRQLHEEPMDWLLADLDALTRPGTEFRFHRCPRCPTIFVRHGKQKFCSRACSLLTRTPEQREKRREQMKTYMRKWRAEKKRQQAKRRKRDPGPTRIARQR